jgi:hypothetical protein
MDPDIIMARLIGGPVWRCACTNMAPALSPQSVMFSCYMSASATCPLIDKLTGSPPKPAIYFLTQSIATRWSFKPRLVSAVPFPSPKAKRFNR